MMKSTVFDRTQADSHGAEIGAALYNLIIGVTLLWGFGVNWWMVQNIPVADLMEINPWIFIIGYFASCFTGIWLFTSSSSPVISFIGYNLVVVPFGLIINIAVSRYNPYVVADAIEITGLVTAMMMVAGSLYPAFFQRIRNALAISLICVIIVEVIQMAFFDRQYGIIDWIVVVIFCGYIGYDWARANAIPKTVDNAIDSAAALYMDIINLFLRILRILGRKK